MSSIPDKYTIAQQISRRSLLQSRWPLSEVIFMLRDYSIACIVFFRTSIFTWVEAPNLKSAGPA